MTAHGHGAWCHPAAGGNCPALEPRPGAGVAGKSTPRRVGTAPHPTSAAWWAAFSALAALIPAAHAWL